MNAPPSLHDVLRRRVDDDFRQRSVPRHGGWLGVAWAVALLGGMVVLHAVALSDRVHGLVFFGVQLSLGLLCYLYAVGVAHEATHGSLSGSARIDRGFVRLFDLVVLSSFVWTHDHLAGHHASVNVVGRDNALNTGGLFRYHEDEVHRPWHRWQHVYAWVLYAGASLHRWFVNDPARLARLARAPEPVTMSGPQRAWFLTGIAVRNGLFLVLPAVLTTVPVLHIVGGFVAMHVLISAPLIVSVQLSHLFDGTELFDAGDAPPPDAALHVTSDFSVDSPVVTLLTGGHNLHTAHHLFPDIHHRHLRRVDGILRETAAEHGLSLTRWASPWGAIVAHHRFLARHGRP